MLWLVPAGLRGGLKLEAYHQSRQPQSLFLCGPRCSGTSVRFQDVAASFSYALLRQPYLRPRRGGDPGFVSRHKLLANVGSAKDLSLRLSCRHHDGRLRPLRFSGILLLTTLDGISGKRSAIIC